MKNRSIIKIFTIFLLTAGIFLIAAIRTKAQQSTSPNNSSTSNNSGEDVPDADLSITANVTAKELKFEAVPNPKVQFTGKPERKTVWESERRNLPQSVEPGVTYRDIGIRLRIASRFADIERIVAEALGEIPIRDDEPQKQPVTENAAVITAKNSSGENSIQPNKRVRQHK